MGVLKSNLESNLIPPRELILKDKIHRFPIQEFYGIPFLARDLNSPDESQRYKLLQGIDFNEKSRIYGLSSFANSSEFTLIPIKKLDSNDDSTMSILLDFLYPFLIRHPDGISNNRLGCYLSKILNSSKHYTLDFDHIGTLNGRIK